MKASIIASTIALFSGALAAPLAGAAAPAPVFTFSLTNDQTGANAPRNVIANGVPVVLGDLFAGATNLFQNGKLIASSAQNIAPGVKVACLFRNDVRSIPLNDKVTFADLDGVPGKAVPVDVTNFTLTCTPSST